MKWVIVNCALLVGIESLLADGIIGNATGFFHVEKIDGRDWAIAPDGRPTVLAGVDWVWPAGFHCEALGYSPYGRFVETNYPSREAWADETASRLHDWGFNFLGSGCDDALLAPRGFAHAAMLNVGYRLSHEDEEKAIAPGLHRPGTAFPNVFHPDFEAAWDEAAARAAAKHRDDPGLLGYYLDNELSWGGVSRNRDEGMFDAVAALPPGHSARKALDAFLAEWSEAHHESVVEAAPSASVKVAFLALVAERYFSVAAGAIRRHDPNHMVLGCRFAGMGASGVVLKAAARHCDIVTFNYYPWADLDRGVVLTRKDGPPLVDAIRAFHEKCGAPLLITEWSFSALDAGRPCSDGAGQRFRTQAERVEAAELCLGTMLSLPFMVGHAWFMWVDQPALGFNKYFHEDCNYGLVSEEGVPYAALTEMFARVHASGSSLRLADPGDAAFGRVSGTTRFRERKRRPLDPHQRPRPPFGPYRLLLDGRGGRARRARVWPLQRARHDDGARLAARHAARLRHARRSARRLPVRCVGGGRRRARRSRPTGWWGEPSRRAGRARPQGGPPGLRRHPPLHTGAGKPRDSRRNPLCAEHRHGSALHSETLPLPVRGRRRAAEARPDASERLEGRQRIVLASCGWLALRRTFARPRGRRLQPLDRSRRPPARGHPVPPGAGTDHPRSGRNPSCPASHGGRDGAGRERFHEKCSLFGAGTRPRRGRHFGQFVETSLPKTATKSLKPL